MTDQNCGSFVDKEVMNMLTSLGTNTVEEQLEGMISEASGPPTSSCYSFFGQAKQACNPDMIRNSFPC